MGRIESGQYLALLALLVGSVCAMPSAAQDDLRLFGIESGPVITQSRHPTLTLTATNLGGALVPSVLVASTNAFDTTVVAVLVDPSCGMQPEGPPTSVRFRWSIGTLLPGENRSCALTFRALPSSPNTVLNVGFRVDADGNTDPVTTNNRYGGVFTVSAIDVLVDIRVAVVRSPAGIVPPGSVGSVTVDVQNVGPSSAPNVGVRSDYFYTTGSATELIDVLLTPTGATKCDVFADDIGPARSLVLVLGTLSSGARVTCTLGFVVTPYAVNPREIAFHGASTGFGVTDLDPSSNRAVLGFQFFPTPVPSTGLGGLLALTVGLIVLAFSRIRTRFAQG